MNTAQVHGKIVALYQTGRFDEALELIDPDVVDHRGGRQGTHRGIDAWRAKWAAMAGGDLTVTVEQNVTQGEISVNRYTVRGPGYAVAGLDMVRVRDGRIVEHWAVLDTDAIAHQTGGLSSPPATRT